MIFRHSKGIRIKNYFYLSIKFTINIFLRYNQPKKMIREEINSKMALITLKKIFELENDHPYKYFNVKINFNNRNMVLERMVKRIAKSKEAETILEGLNILRKDKNSDQRSILRDILCKEALVRCYENDFTLMQLIEMVNIFAEYKDPDYFNVIDVLWIGIKSRENDIDVHNLNLLFKILKNFSKSKNLVRNF